MLILLKGTVSVRMSGGTEVATVEAVDTVGEMGIVSPLPRTANIVASTPVSGMTVGKGVLEGLVENDPVLGIKLLR